jgi:hypothetical protein
LDYLKNLGSAARDEMGRAVSGGVQAVGDTAQGFLGNVEQPAKMIAGIDGLDTPLDTAAKGVAQTPAR